MRNSLLQLLVHLSTPVPFPKPLRKKLQKLQLQRKLLKHLLLKKAKNPAEEKQAQPSAVEDETAVRMKIEALAVGNKA